MERSEGRYEGCDLYTEPGEALVVPCFTTTFQRDTSWQHGHGWRIGRVRKAGGLQIRDQIFFLGYVQYRDFSYCKSTSHRFVVGSISTTSATFFEEAPLTRPNR